MQLSSTAFSQSEAILGQHTGEGEDVSPALSWRNGPQGTKSFAINCHDPDTPLIFADGKYGFVHWVYYNISAPVTRLEKECRDYTIGITDFGVVANGGLMPPNGYGRQH